jgi:hypothetical protein
MGTISAEAVLLDANTLFSRVLPADRPLLEATQKEAFLNMSVFNVVIRVHGANGELRHLRLCSQPRRQADNSVVWDGIAIDVTDQERIAAELRKLNLELEQRVAQRTAALTQANRDLESFSYVIAHDLRAPLRHIEGYATLLSEDQGAQLSNESQKLLAGIHTSAATMQQLIDSILAISRLEHGPLNIHRIDLSELANQITTELQMAEPQRKVKVLIEPGVDADADPVLIKNVLTNLFSNAWKFTSTKPIGVIEFGALKHGTDQKDEYDGQIVVFVRDNGMGFAPNQAQRLFDLFQRHPDHKHVAGHGIGLASVRNIINNHGGKVWSEGLSGEGATFYFSLPILQHQNAVSV